jgi:hypothetical protein
MARAETLLGVTRVLGVSTAAVLALVAGGCGGGHRTTGSKATSVPVAQPSISGPASVQPGRTVLFQASGFRAGSRLSVVISAAAKPNCCAIRIQPDFPVSAAGDATLSFRMPDHLLDCPQPQQCRRVPWRAGENAVVTASAYLEQAGTITAVRP